MENKMKALVMRQDEVKAILDGTKTQFRRPMNPQPVLMPNATMQTLGWDYPSDTMFLSDEHGNTTALPKAPFQVGAVRWVRETFGVTSKANPIIKQTLPMFEYTWYVMDGEDELDKGYELLYKATQDIDPDFPIRWRPSIHMPKWAARIFIKPTRVWAERVQDMTVKDAIAEGIREGSFCFDDNGSRTDERSIFAWGIWDSCYPGSWDRNDWVFACEFERVNKPEGE